MFDKQDFHKLAQAHYTHDRYIETMIEYWHEEKFQDNPDFDFEDLVWKDKHSDDVINVKFSNGDEYDIPRQYFYSNKDYDGNEYPVIEMQWYSNFYDGPLSGLALLDGKKVWFECSKMDDPIDIRVFKLYELSEAEMIIEEYWHGLFRKHIGTHCDYGSDSAQYFTGGDNPDIYWKLAEESKPNRDYTNNKCLGTYDECIFTQRK